MRQQPKRFTVLCLALLGLVACTGGELVPGDDDDAGGPPFDVAALACEHDFVNERLGGVHYWLLDLQADGSFEQTFPNTVGDRVTGTYDVETGALSATVTYDEGFKAVEETVVGTVIFEIDGDTEASTTATTTFLDGFVEVSERVSGVEGCGRTVELTHTDRDGLAVAGTIVTTFTGAMTADEIIDATIGDDVTIHYDSELLEDFSRTDDTVFDDVTTTPSPDQDAQRTMLGDGTGEGTYTNYREDGGTQDGTWTYHADGDQDGDWEVTIPDAPFDPFAWGESSHHLDGSGSSDYTRMSMQGQEVSCHSEWDADDHGFTECDDGFYEDF